MGVYAQITRSQWFGERPSAENGGIKCDRMVWFTLFKARRKERALKHEVKKTKKWFRHRGGPTSGRDGQRPRAAEPNRASQPSVLLASNRFNFQFLLKLPVFLSNSLHRQPQSRLSKRRFKPSRHSQITTLNTVVIACFKRRFTSSLNGRRPSPATMRYATSWPVDH